MPQQGLLREQSEPGAIAAPVVAGHVLIPDDETLPAVVGNRVPRPRRWSRLRDVLRQGRLTERTAGRMRAFVEEEAAHGHGFLFVPVLVGGGAAFWFALARDPPATVLALLLLAFAAATVAAQRRTGRLPLLLFLPALVLAGMNLAQFETWRQATVILDSPVTTTVTGEVHRREPAGEGRWRYIIRIASTEEPTLRRPPRDAVLLARGRHPPFAAGDTVRGRARMSPPSGPALPGLNDFAFRSFHDGIGAVGFFYGAPQPVEPTTVGERDWRRAIERWIFALRSTIADRIREVVPGDAGAFAAAIVTDERRAISKETTEALRISGLAHIVAISGLNMALAAGIFFVGLRGFLCLFTGFAQAWPVKKIAAAGALLMATAYYLISGFAVSAERAYLMMAVTLIAVWFDRAAISLRNIAVAALIMLAVAPSQVMGPRFQMSFAATAALVAGYAWWSRRAAAGEREPSLMARGRLAPVMTGWHWMAGIFATSLIGGLSTAIFSMEHFHRLAGYGLAANLAVMPIISFVVMPAGLLAMLLMPLGLDAPLLGLMGMGLEAVIAVAGHVAAWGGDVGTGRQHRWFLAIASAGFLLLALLRTPLRLLGVPAMLLAFALSWHEARLPMPDLLVSDDGTLVALTTGPVATSRTRPPAFIFDQWQRALLLPDPVAPVVSPAGDIGLAATDEPSAASSADPSSSTLPTAPQTAPRTASRIAQLTDDQRARVRSEMKASLAAAAADAGRFHCRQKAWCLAVTREGAVVAVVEDPRLAGSACDIAALVVAPRTRLAECLSGALMLNGASLRRTGALEIRMNGSPDPSMWRAHAASADTRRPWTSHRLYDWRTDRFDETLPRSLLRLLSGSAG